MVVKWEYGIDILPLAQLGCDGSSAFLSGSCDHVVDLSVSLGIGQGLVLEGFPSVLVWLDLSNTVQPVFDSRIA
jgi:hypothetical protein